MVASPGELGAKGRKSAPVRLNLTSTLSGLRRHAQRYASLADAGTTTKVVIEAAARADLEALVLRIERHFKARPA